MRKRSEKWYGMHLTVDIPKLRQNPELLSEFKKFYPKKYHKYGEVIASLKAFFEDATKLIDLENKLFEEAISTMKQ